MRPRDWMSVEQFFLVALVLFLFWRWQGGQGLAGGIRRIPGGQVLFGCSGPLSVLFLLACRRGVRFKGRPVNILVKSAGMLVGSDRT